MASRPGGDEGPDEEDTLVGGGGQEGVPFSEGVLAPLVLRWQPEVGSALGWLHPLLSGEFGSACPLSAMLEAAAHALPSSGSPDTSHFPGTSPSDRF